MIGVAGQCKAYSRNVAEATCERQLTCLLGVLHHETLCLQL